MSGNPEDYINSDLEDVNEPLPGAGVGGIKLPSAGITAGSQSNPVEGDIGLKGSADASIGGTTSGQVNGSPDEYARLEKYVDPFTGEIIYRRVVLKTKNSRYGEQVHNLITLND